MANKKTKGGQKAKVVAPSPAGNKRSGTARQQSLTQMELPEDQHEFVHKNKKHAVARREEKVYGGRMSAITPTPEVHSPEVRGARDISEF